MPEQKTFNGNFDVQPITPFKGKFDVQPLLPDYGPEQPEEFVGPLEPKLGVKGTIDKAIVGRLRQLSGEEPGILNPDPNANPALNKPFFEPLPRNARMTNPELFPEDNRSFIGKTVDSLYDTGASMINSIFSPLGALGTVMGSNPADMSLEATGVGVTKPKFKAVNGKLELLEEPRLVEKSTGVKTAEAPKFENLQSKLDKHLSAEPKFTESLKQSEGRTVGEQKAVMDEAKPAEIKTVGTLRDKTKLRPELAKAKPRFNIGSESYNPQFTNDIDKALYIVAQDTASARNADYLEFLKANFPNISDSEFKIIGRQLRSTMKDHLKKYEPGDVTIPSFWDNAGGLLDRMKSETGALKLRGFKSDDLQRIRKGMLDDIAAQKKLNLSEIYQKYGGRLSESQFGKIVDDIIESGDLTKTTPQIPVTAEIKNPSMLDAIRNVRNKLAEHVTARAEQDQLVRAERANRASKLASLENQGVEGYEAKRQALKGAYPKTAVEPLNEAVSQIDMDQLMNMTEGAFTDKFQKFNAQRAIAKVLGISGDLSPLQPNEIDLLHTALGPEVTDELVQLHGGLGAVADHGNLYNRITEIGNLQKSWQSAMDLSAPFRQGKTAMLRKEWYPAFRDMFKYATSEDIYKAQQAALQTRPKAELGYRAGLALSEIPSDIAKSRGLREEAFISSMPEKLPGLGRIYRGSERAYIGFIDQVRANVFDNMVDDLEKLGIKTQDVIEVKNKAGEIVKRTIQPTKETRELAKFVNQITGRGDLGKLEKHGDLLNIFTYSPRFQASRLQLMARAFKPSTYTTLPKPIRNEYLKSMLVLAGFTATANSLGEYFGGKSLMMDSARDLLHGDFNKALEKTTSTDFGKTVYGRTRHDPGAGFLQYLTLFSRFIQGKSMSTNETGGEGTLHDLNKEKKGPYDPTYWSTFDQFRFGKDSPMAALVEGMMKGRTVTGEKFDLKTEVGKQFIPMFQKDLWDLYQSDPSIFPTSWEELIHKSPEIAGKATLGIGAGLGEGVNTFEPRLNR